MRWTHLLGRSVGAKQDPYLFEKSPCDGIGRHASFRNSCLRRVGSSPTGGNERNDYAGHVGGFENAVS